MPDVGHRRRRASTRASAVRAGTLVALIAACCATAAVAFALLGSASGYELSFRFESAGQLIAGDHVKVGGVNVGTIEELSLTEDGLAEVRVRVDDDRYTPLHAGTEAGIGTVGLSGVTNRFIALYPGPRSAPELEDGTTLDTTATRPLVDIDQLLNAATPEVRRHLSDGIRRGSDVFDGNVAPTRRTFEYAQAALSRLQAFAGELTADTAAFSQLIGSGATVARTVADRESALTEGIGNTATAFEAVAAARTDLEQSLDRAPGTLDEATLTIGELRRTLRAVDPAMRDARPVTGPLATVLRRLVPTLQAARPPLDALDAQLPALRRALRQVPPTAATAVPALRESTRALRGANPIFTALRPYSQDFVQAQIHGLGGNIGFNYDANGHFARVGFGISPRTAAAGLVGLRPPVENLLRAQTNRCPGAAAEPPADGTSPVTVPHCDPKQNPPG